jgi:hypothetical protein
VFLYGSNTTYCLEGGENRIYAKFDDNPDMNLAYKRSLSLFIILTSTNKTYGR